MKKAASRSSFQKSCQSELFSKMQPVGALKKKAASRSSYEKGRQSELFSKKLPVGALFKKAASRRSSQDEPHVVPVALTKKLPVGALFKKAASRRSSQDEPHVVPVALTKKPPVGALIKRAAFSSPQEHGETLIYLCSLLYFIVANFSFSPLPLPLPPGTRGHIIISLLNGVLLRGFCVGSECSHVATERDSPRERRETVETGTHPSLGHVQPLAR